MPRRRQRRRGAPQIGLSNAHRDTDEKETNDQDQDRDGDVGATAEAPAEAVIREEPENPAKGADAVSERGRGESGEILPFQPEKIVEQSTQHPDAVMVSVEFFAARVQGAKSDSSEAEGGTNAVENRRSGPGSQSAPWEEITPRARSAIEARCRDSERTKRKLPKSPILRGADGCRDSERTKRKLPKSPILRGHSPPEPGTRDQGPRTKDN